MTTTGDTDADVELGEVVGAGDQEGLVQLGAQDLLAEQLEGLAVDADQTVALLALGDRCETTKPVSKKGVLDFCCFSSPPGASGPRGQTARIFPYRSRSSSFRRSGRPTC